MNCPSFQHPNADHGRFCDQCAAPLGASSSSEADPMIGLEIDGGFRIVRLIGEGGMGKVYEGAQSMAGSTRKVAIKTLHPHLSADPEIAAQFHRQCETVIKLRHPNTIQVLTFGQAPQGPLYIVMEFVEGQSISRILRQQGSMDPTRVDNIVRQVCGSLSEAHAMGIVHLNLKPDSIILSTPAGASSDFVTVLDFGIAARAVVGGMTLEQRLTQQGMILGTPPYMSPEQFTGQALDGRSDIYSLGVMIYEMLTGKLPFHANSALEWAFQHVKERPFPFERDDAPRGATVPMNRKQAVMRALSKHPGERQASVTEFLEEFSETKDSMPPPGEPPIGVVGAEVSQHTTNEPVLLGGIVPSQLMSEAAGTGTDVAAGQSGTVTETAAVVRDAQEPAPPDGGPVVPPVPVVKAKRKLGVGFIVGAGAVAFVGVGAVAFVGLVAALGEATGYGSREYEPHGAHTCALKPTGAVVCWGRNGIGQLGDGTTEDRLVPTQVATLDSGVSAIANGLTHTCALKSTGAVVCWGSNSSGALRVGATTNRLAPTPVVGLTSGVSAIAAGSDHTCALMSTGGAVCWGSNGNGQLGDGTTVGRYVARPVARLTSGVSAIGAGGDHTCALMSTGAVVCFGGNVFGQLGDGTTVTRLVPTPVVEYP